MNDFNMITPSRVQGTINKFCYTIGILPSSYKQSLTYEEQICWIGNFLETKIYPAINNNAEALAELQGLFIDLKNYVDNYFDDLDVQEEINNKIDEMAESGDLQEIITQYLQVAGVLCYNTINDLKNATNLIEGSFARTFGKTTYNDGNGALYKIRTITSGDIVDEDNIISVNFSNTLIGEKQHNIDIETLMTQMTDIVPRVENLEKITSKPYMVVIGDSWSDMNNDYEWPERVAQQNNYNLINKAVAGSGWSYGTTFYQQVQNAFDYCEAEEIDTDLVKLLIIFGGVNDYRQGNSTSTVNSAADSCLELAQTKFPKARIITITSNMGAWQTYDSITPRTRTNYADFPNWNNYITNHIQNLGIGEVVKDAYLWLNIYGSNFSNVYNEDLLHPSNLGHKIIASYINQIINGSYEGVKMQFDYGSTTHSSINSITYDYNIGLKGNHLNYEMVIHMNNYTPTSSGFLDFDFPGWHEGIMTPNKKFNNICSAANDFTNQNVIYGIIRLEQHNVRLYLKANQTYGDIFLSGSVNLG